MHLLSCCATSSVVVGSCSLPRRCAHGLFGNRKDSHVRGELALAMFPISPAFAGCMGVLVKVVLLLILEVVDIGGEVRPTRRSYWLGKLPYAKGWQETTSTSFPFPYTATMTTTLSTLWTVADTLLNEANTGTDSTCQRAGLTLSVSRFWLR